jgi:hypothetical protein
MAEEFVPFPWALGTEDTEQLFEQPRITCRTTAACVDHMRCFGTMYGERTSGWFHHLLFTDWQ